MMKDVPEISFKTNNEVKGFSLVSFAYLKSLPKDQHPKDHSPFEPHRLGFNVLLFMTGGNARHWVDFEFYDLKKDDLLVLRKGQIHYFDPKHNYEGFLLLFQSEYLFAEFANPTIGKLSILNPFGTAAPLLTFTPFQLSIVETLAGQLDSDSPFLAQRIAAQLSLLLLDVEEANTKASATSTAATHNGKDFGRFTALLFKHFSKEKNATFYAEQMSISYRQLNALCKAKTGKTVKANIDLYTILEAKRHLVGSRRSIKEIAIELGFAEQTNFTKFFKTRVKQTPLEFRTEHR